MSGGSCRAARAIIDWTSCAAASMSRSKVNWIVTLVLPCELVELIESTPAIAENCFSSGVARGPMFRLAPASDAWTWSWVSTVRQVADRQLQVLIAPKSHRQDDSVVARPALKLPRSSYAPVSRCDGRLSRAHRVQPEIPSVTTTSPA